mgnify:FL=1
MSTQNIDKLKTNFGTRVEELMRERNVKPGDFYKAMGIVPQAFYDWKKKDQVPYATTALKVAKYFGVSVEYLIEGTLDNPLQKKVEELQGRIRDLAQELSDIIDRLATNP